MQARRKYISGSITARYRGLRLCFGATRILITAGTMEVGALTVMTPFGSKTPKSILHSCWGGHDGNWIDWNNSGCLGRQSQRNSGLGTRKIWRSRWAAQYFANFVFPWPSRCHIFHNALVVKKPLAGLFVFRLDLQSLWVLQPWQWSLRW